MGNGRRDIIRRSISLRPWSITGTSTRPTTRGQGMGVSVSVEFSLEARILACREPIKEIWRLKRFLVDDVRHALRIAVIALLENVDHRLHGAPGHPDVGI